MGLLWLGPPFPIQWESERFSLVARREISSSCPTTRLHSSLSLPFSQPFFLPHLFALFVSQTNDELQLYCFSLVLRLGFGVFLLFFCFPAFSRQPRGKLEVCVAGSGWFSRDLAGCVPFGSCSSWFEAFMVRFLSPGIARNLCVPVVLKIFPVVFADWYGLYWKLWLDQGFVLWFCCDLRFGRAFLLSLVWFVFKWFVLSRSSSIPRMVLGIAWFSLFFLIEICPSSFWSILFHGLVALVLLCSSANI